jgi:hypothetical protein
MGQIKRNPSAGGAGARNADHIGSLIASENKPSLADLQAYYVSRRFAVSTSMAMLITALVFHNGRRA